MAWNGSGEGKAKVKGQQGSDRCSAVRPDSSPLFRRGLVAGLVIVLGGAAAFWFLRGGRAEGPAPTAEDADSRAIKAVTPTKAPEQAPAKRPPPKGLLKQRVGEERNGYRLLPSGELYKIGKVMTNSSSRISLADKIFDQPTDQTIGNLLSVVPGSGFLGDSKDYYKNFDRHFRESLKTEIVINDDDSEEVRELKQAVIDVRAELKEKMDAGEDINQVMRETRDQMKELGLYREELEKQINDIIRNQPEKEFSKQDVADLIDAANSMLKERGSAPVRLTASMAYQLHRASVRKNALGKETKGTGK